jgi:hypothetical protein
MTLSSTPACSSATAQLWRLFRAQNNGHNTERSITLRKSDAKGISRGLPPSLGGQHSGLSARRLRILGPSKAFEEFEQLITGPVSSRTRGEGGRSRERPLFQGKVSIQVDLRRLGRLVAEP